MLVNPSFWMPSDNTGSGRAPAWGTRWASTSTAARDCAISGFFATVSARSCSRVGSVVGLCARAGPGRTSEAAAAKAAIQRMRPASSRGRANGEHRFPSRGFSQSNGFRVEPSRSYCVRFGYQRARLGKRPKNGGLGRASSELSKNWCASFKADAQDFRTKCCRCNSCASGYARRAGIAAARLSTPTLG